ncbi:transposase [Streptomyces chartreusis]|uniref:Transposase n=1 Tax=Streptomyces chartreusis TaxID=1969 RepID=A0A7H8T5N5_STRCX|nr:transposase [Streptomyces chartreusis]QKZ18826.1 transposase [Streptomyces chartreusis]
MGGRKRHLGCDTLGLPLTVLITAARVSGTAAGVTLLSRIAAAHPHITKPRVDAGYHTTAIGHGARLGNDAHPSNARGFTIIPTRWTIERRIDSPARPPRTGPEPDPGPKKNHRTKISVKGVFAMSGMVAFVSTRCRRPN